MGRKEPSVAQNCRKGGRTNKSAPWIHFLGISYICLLKLYRQSIRKFHVDCIHASSLTISETFLHKETTNFELSNILSLHIKYTYFVMKLGALYIFPKLIFLNIYIFLYKHSPRGYISILVKLTDFMKKSIHLVWWLAIPHRKNVGFKSTILLGPFWVEFACFPGTLASSHNPERYSLWG